MAAQQNEAAWLDYYHSGVLGQKLTNREVILARRAFLAGRESAKRSVQTDGATCWACHRVSVAKTRDGWCEHCGSPRR